MTKTALLQPHALDQRIRYAYHRGSHPNDFEHGRSCAAAALQALGAESFFVGADPFGAPVWPAETVGSITHTKGFASAAVAWSREFRSIGIDSETIEDHDAAEAVREICFFGEERFLTQNRIRDTEISLIVFSAKEAVYKCLYPLLKLSFTFEDIRITDIDWDAEVFLWDALRQQSNGSFRRDAGLVHSSVFLAQA